MTKLTFAQQLAVPSNILQLFEAKIKPTIGTTSPGSVVAIARASEIWYHGEEPNEHSLFVGENTARAYAKAACTFPNATECDFSFLDINTGDPRTIYDALRMSDEDYQRAHPTLEALLSAFESIVHFPQEKGFSGSERELIATNLAPAVGFSEIVQTFAGIYSGNPNRTLYPSSSFDHATYVPPTLSAHGNLRLGTFLKYIHDVFKLDKFYFDDLHANETSVHPEHQSVHNTDMFFPFVLNVISVFAKPYMVVPGPHDNAPQYAHVHGHGLRPRRIVTAREMPYWSTMGGGFARGILHDPDSSVGSHIPSHEPQNVYFLTHYGIIHFSPNKEFYEEKQKDFERLLAG